MKTFCLISTLFTLIVICESLEIVHDGHLTDWTSFPAPGHRDDNMQSEDLRKLQVDINVTHNLMTDFACNNISTCFLLNTEIWTHN